MSPAVSTPRIVAVIFLQFDGEHRFKTRPATWVQVVLIGAVYQIIAKVLVRVAVLVTLLIRMLTVVVQH